MSKRYEIKIHLVRGTSVEADPSPVLHIGDTVRYSCTEGMARIVFPSGSPYAVSKVHDAHNHTVKKPGNFRYECYVTPTGQTKEIGYNPNDPKSGGEHEVVP